MLTRNMRRQMEKEKIGMPSDRAEPPSKRTREQRKRIKPNQEEKLNTAFSGRASRVKICEESLSKRPVKQRMMPAGDGGMSTSSTEVVSEVKLHAAELKLTAGNLNGVPEVQPHAADLKLTAGNLFMMPAGDGGMSTSSTEGVSEVKLHAAELKLTAGNLNGVPEVKPHAADLKLTAGNLFVKPHAAELELRDGHLKSVAGFFDNIAELELRDGHLKSVAGFFDNIDRFLDNWNSVKYKYFEMYNIDPSTIPYRAHDPENIFFQRSQRRRGLL